MAFMVTWSSHAILATIVSFAHMTCPYYISLDSQSFFLIGVIQYHLRISVFGTQSSLIIPNTHQSVLVSIFVIHRSAFAVVGQHSVPYIAIGHIMVL